MFTFFGDEDISGIKITSPHFNGNFIPGDRLPKFDSIDVNVPKCRLIFTQSDGEVSLAWDTNKVSFDFCSFEAGKGSFDVNIPKSDDSLKLALTEWIEYEKQKTTVNEQEETRLLFEQQEKDSFNDVSKKVASFLYATQRKQKKLKTLA